MSRHTVPTVLLALLLATPTTAAAQLWGPTSSQGSSTQAPRSAPAPPVPTADMPRQVISGNPYGYMINLFNAEYEVRASDHITFGAGASRLAWGPDGFDRQKPYINSDAFVRYHPGGEAFNGLALGIKAGYTRLPSSGGHLGVGFDVNQNLMLTKHLYSSAGFGLKRLLNRPPGFFNVTLIPTLRWNVGVGF